MAVLLTPPALQFFDNDGAPLAAGLVYTYAAGTTTAKPTYTDSTATTSQANPVVLDSAGRPPGGSIWLSGSYKFVVKDSAGATISTTDNVTAFNITSGSSDPFFNSFSGNGSQTVFTVSEDLGTEEKAIFVFVNDEAGDVGFNIAAPTDFTIDGTSLTFITAPPSGTNNVYVWAPSTLVAAASAAAASADSSSNASALSATEAAASAASLADFRQFDATGSGNAFVGDLTPDATLSDGAVFRFKANHNITGASTMNIDGLGAKTIKKLYNSDVVSGDIVSGGFYWIQYDLTNDTFQLLTSFSQTSTAVTYATAAEVSAGTVSNKSVNPEALSDSDYGLWMFDFSVPYPTVADGFALFKSPPELAGMNIVSADAYWSGTAGTGATTTFMLHNLTQGADVFSTIGSILTGAQADDGTLVIDTAEDDITSGDVFQVDFDAIGSTVAGTGFVMRVWARIP